MKENLFFHISFWKIIGQTKTMQIIVQNVPILNKTVHLKVSLICVKIEYLCKNPVRHFTFCCCCCCVAWKCSGWNKCNVNVECCCCCCQMLGWQLDFLFMSYKQQITNIIWRQKEQSVIIFFYYDEKVSYINRPVSWINMKWIK